MATAGAETGNGVGLRHALVGLGDFTLFALRTFAWMLTRRPPPGTLLPACYYVGVRSVPVVAITGMFIGMVLAVQFYQQFNRIGIGTRMGGPINVSLVRELGPVLAATMLAGRVGGAMAAELATMRITEQVDALSALGAHPLRYLVVPRFLACVLLIPLLTILADFMGVMGAAFLCTRVYGIEAHHYWEHTAQFVGLYDVFSGLAKALVFGSVIALVSCHRGLNSRPGAEGVGQAATEAFVTSFVVILVIDFFLGTFLITLYQQLWPDSSPTWF